MGGAIKSITKPVGDIVGGVTGGITGGIMGQQEQFKAEKRPIDKQAFELRDAENVRKQALTRSETQRAQAGKTRQSQDQLRQQSQGLIQQLQARAAGRGPSLAQAQLQQATDKNLAQQLATAGRARGGSAASTQRALMRRQSEASQKLASESAMLRMQEQLESQKQLMGAISAGRQAEQARAGMENQMAQQYLAQGLGAAQAMQQARADYEKLETKQHLASQGYNLSGFESAHGGAQQMMGGLLSSGALALGAMSDENVKKDKKKDKVAESVKEFGKALQKKRPSGSEARQKADSYVSEISDKNKKKNIKTSDIKKEFLDKLTAYDYKYKDSKHGKGDNLSVMAQDLEKTKFGKSMVIDTPEGKMVDYGKGFGAILAAQSHLNKRLEEIENRSKKKA